MKVAAMERMGGEEGVKRTMIKVGRWMEGDADEGDEGGTRKYATAG
jgi:hypothetical protein